VKRFSVSLPPSLVEEFNETWQSMQYDSRSKAVHDAVRAFITEVEWMKRESGSVVGVVLVLYYLDKPALVDEITTLQGRFRGVVVTIQQLYIEENKMLGMIVVKGNAGEVKQLTQELMSMRGVKQVKASLIAP
jgi:CopG family nickel-responsive transcriptional regulator